VHDRNNSLRSCQIEYDLWSLLKWTQANQIHSTNCTRCQEYDLDVRKKICLLNIQDLYVDTSFLTLDLIYRSKHSIHESLKSWSLFCNSMLMMLVRVIADNAFQNYNTMKELLTIKSLKNEMYHLWQNENVCDKLFFFVISSEEMKKINMFSRRLRCQNHA